MKARPAGLIVGKGRRSRAEKRFEYSGFLLRFPVFCLIDSLERQELRNVGDTITRGVLVRRGGWAQWRFMLNKRESPKFFQENVWN
jgi:hypothetical protein